ncbi:MAG: carbamoyltransferase HypF, partial [Bacteroidetes bacterium]|nr:carbamoyltransferase HypF [Bacteroidota bacterium]
MNKAEEANTYQIHIQGLVQGVGFRPFIYRIATHHKLSGWVENRNDGVFIKVNATDRKIQDFIISVKEESPEASNIFTIETTEIKNEKIKDFRIIKSENKSDEITEVSPDIAVCKDCIDDLKTQSHRIDYPFINCTNCGPRFTIIQDIPYDRDMTTMNPFKMCNECNSEYVNVLDRRFHAQPLACNTCGPTYRLHHGERVINNFEEIIRTTCELLEQGEIVAIKGLGGFHLACDATNEEAVKRLREAKNRDGKPFAVMFSSVEAMQDYVEVDRSEQDLLTSWRTPIVLTKDKGKLAPSVSMGFQNTGVMLPYMPFHHLLFVKLKLAVIVLTSGNISNEPIIINNEDGLNKLGSIAKAVLIYNREIYNRTDDSVAFITNDKPRLIRRSRSYAPSPIRLKINVEGIFAAGAELVNCFCMGREKQAILSQHIGDLKNLETLDFYSESVSRFKKLFRVKPTLVAHDLHPDYLSTRFAKELNLPLIGIQHHHAHIVSCMAEHQLDEKVIGIALDGIGYGDDGNTWGGEFLICDLADYHRYTHFEYIKMPGGDRATKHPWRMALSYMYQYYGDSYSELKLEFLKNIPQNEIDLVVSMLQKNINCPLTSSTGRLFDAVAALTNICTEASFHAEAPMRLEAAIDDISKDSYEFKMNSSIKLEALFKGIVKDLQNGISNAEISTKFHRTIINIILAAVCKMRGEYNINKVV